MIRIAIPALGMAIPGLLLVAMPQAVRFTHGGILRTIAQRTVPPRGSFSHNRSRGDLMFLACNRPSRCYRHCPKLGYIRLTLSPRQRLENAARRVDSFLCPMDNSLTPCPAERLWPHTRRKSSAAVQTPLETYLREINETALLSASDEQELALAIGLGDTRARDRMVRANLRLVVNIARGYTGKGLSLQDLIEEGNLGLLRAVEGFDPAMGTRFSTYASYWIKQSIKRALINSAKTIRIPAYMVELLSKWRRATARLTEELGRTPTPEEIARVLGLPRKKLPIIKKAIRIYNSTPQTDQTEAGWSLGEMIMDENLKSPEDEMLAHDNLSHVMADAEDDGRPRGDRVANAVRPGRSGAADAEGNRRIARPDARARSSDRDRSPRQARRRPGCRAVRDTAGGLPTVHGRSAIRRTSARDGYPWASSALVR